MRIPPLSNIIMIMALCALGVVQIALVLQFWSGFAEDDPFFKLVFQGLGVCFAIIELVALGVCAAAAHRGNWARANIFRVAFVLLFIINLIGDLGAMYQFSMKDAGVRETAFRQGLDAETSAKEEAGRRDALHAALARQNLDLPASALQIQYAAAVKARDAGGVGETTHNWRVARAATLQAALETAKQIEALDKKIEQSRYQASKRPQSDLHPQIEAITMVLLWSGVQVTGQSARLMIAVLMAVTLRFVMAFGFWVAIPTRYQLFEDDDGGDGGSSTPKRPDLRSKDVPANPASPASVERGREARNLGSVIRRNKSPEVRRGRPTELDDPLDEILNQLEEQYKREQDGQGPKSSPNRRPT